jgi:hypothetical protein
VIANVNDSSDRPGSPLLVADPFAFTFEGLAVA